MPLSSIEDLSLAYGLNHFEVDRPFRTIAEGLGARLGDLSGVGSLAGREIYEAAYRVDRLSQPLLIAWSYRGERVDKVWLDPYERMLLERLVYEERVNASPLTGEGWLRHFASIYLVGDPGFACILTITAQTAFTLSKYGPEELRGTVRRLAGLERPLALGATWFTEAQGGSDLGANATEAWEEGGIWRLRGYKYFASGAGIADVALVTARPRGAPPGAKGLALFAVPRVYEGRLNYRVTRLKWKSGTVAVPTGEVELDGSAGYLLGRKEEGIYYTLESLMVSRLDNSFGALGIARKAYLEAYLYARERRAFGRRVVEHPLALRDLLEAEVEIEAMLALTLRAAKAFDEASGDRPPYTPRYHYARLLTHIAKNATAEASARITALAMELWGGIGFLHEFPVERWHREAMITPIWEGTSNIQALDMLEAMAKKGAHLSLLEDLERASSEAYDRELARSALEAAKRALGEASSWGPVEAQYRAKDLLRTLAAAASVVFLEEAAGRLSDERLHLAASIYYSWKLGGKMPLVPEGKALEIVSLGGALPA